MAEVPYNPVSVCVCVCVCVCVTYRFEKIDSDRGGLFAGNSC